MAVSTILKTVRDGTITISDGDGNSYTVSYEAGDLSIDIPGQAITLNLDRNVIGGTPSLRYGDEAPMTFSFSTYLRDLRDASGVTLADIILGRYGAASSWVSTLGEDAEVFTVDVTWTIAGAIHGDVDDGYTVNHTLKLPYCVLRCSIGEGDPSSLSITGTSYAVFPIVDDVNVAPVV